MKLADYELHRMNNPGAAVQALRAALYVDPLEQSAQQQFLEASAAARNQTAGKRSGNGPSGGSSNGGGLAPSPGG
jgi:hypothetical protein